MRIIIDTREQNPLEFCKSYNFIESISHEKLSVGDYAVQFKDGYIPKIRIERKSVSDLYGTLSSGYDRFKKEIERAKEEEIFFILAIEESIFTVRSGHDYSKKDGDSIIQQVITLWLKHNVWPMFFSSRAEMSYFIYKTFYNCGLLYINNVLHLNSKSKKIIKEIL